MDLGCLDDRPSGLRRFRDLLRSCPLCAVVSDERLLLCAVQLTADGRRLVENRAWPVAHWDLFGEASDLFWRDDEVFDWLSGHPCAGVGVHYRNVDDTALRPGPELRVFCDEETSGDG